MRIGPSPFAAPRARAAVLARGTGLDTDSAIARIIAASVPADAEGCRPRIAEREQLFKPASFDSIQPPSVLKPGYDLAAYLAQRCAQAYAIPDTDIRATIEADGGTDCMEFRRWTDVGFGYRLGPTAVIAFRGTNLWNPVQWLHSNLLAVPWGQPMRHLGFQLAWQRMRAQVLDWLEHHLPAGGELILTGHSLGGAMALLAAYELAERYPIRAVVTIGAPRVGLSAFRDRYLSRPCRPAAQGAAPVVLGDVTRRIAHADDFVSRVPPPPLFRHVGEASRLAADGSLTIGDSRAALGRVLGAFDHAIGWIYERIDTLSAEPTTTVLGPDGPMQVPIGRLLGSWPPGKLAAPPKSAAARLLADATTAGRAPWLLQLALPVLQWVLLGAGAVIALGVFLLGCLDLRSHPSGLYVAAFMKHYRWPVPPSNIAWVSSDPAVRRYMAEALAKVRAASKRN